MINRSFWSRREETRLEVWRRVGEAIGAELRPSRSGFTARCQLGDRILVFDVSIRGSSYVRKVLRGWNGGGKTVIVNASITPQADIPRQFRTVDGVVIKVYRVASEATAAVAAAKGRRAKDVLHATLLIAEALGLTRRRGF